MAIRLLFDRIPPGVEIGPHRHGVETVVYIAGGAIVFEHGDELDRRTLVRAGRQRLRYCVVAAPARDRRAGRELMGAPRRRMDA